MRQCPGCGKERVRLSLVETVPGEMVEVNPDSLLPAYLRNREHVWDQLCSYALQKKSDATDPARARRFVAAKRKAWSGSFPRKRYQPPFLDRQGVATRKIVSECVDLG